MQSRQVIEVTRRSVSAYKVLTSSSWYNYFHKLFSSDASTWLPLLRHIEPAFQKAYYDAETQIMYLFGRKRGRDIDMTLENVMWSLFAKPNLHWFVHAEV